MSHWKQRTKELERDFRGREDEPRKLVQLMAHDEYLALLKRAKRRRIDVRGLRIDQLREVLGYDCGTFTPPKRRQHVTSVCVQIGGAPEAKNGK